MRKDRCLVFDITLIARWIGRPVGIPRCEQALARYALKARPDIRFAVFDRPVSWDEAAAEIFAAAEAV